MSDTTELHRLLNRWQWHWRVRQTARWSVRGAFTGLAIGVGLGLAARLAPLWETSQWLTWAVLSGVGGALAGGLLAGLWPQTPARAARRFEIRAELESRLSTALELAAQPVLAPEWLRQQQLADAVRMARAADMRHALPRPWQRADLWLTLIAAFSLLALAAWPNPHNLALQRQQAVQQAAQQQAAALADIIKQVEANPNLTDDQKEQITQPLSEAQQALQNTPLTQEQAERILAETQQELRALNNPQAIEQAQNLQQAGSGLTDNATTQNAGQALAEGNFEQAAQELANIDPANLTPAEQQALANELEQAAQQLQATNPELAQQLQAAADALRRGDVSAARSALQQAARTVQQTGQAADQAQAAQQAAQQVGESQQAMAQAGQTGQQGQTGQTGQQGQTGQTGQTGQQGQTGTGNQQGGGTGAGTGAGTGTGNGDQQGGASGGNQNNTTGGGNDGGTGVYEPIYAPQLLGGAGGPQVDLPQNNTGQPGGELVNTGPADLQNTGNVLVPYNQALPQYQQNAFSAMENNPPPPNLRTIVRDYFTSLQP